MRLISFTALLLFIFVTHGISQVLQPERVEIEIKESENDFTVVSADEEGIIIFRKDELNYNNREKGKNSWEFIKYDTSLKEQWKRTYGIDINYELIGYDYENGQLVLLFQDGPYYDRSMGLINMTANSGDTIVHSIKRVVPIVLSYFEIVGQTVVLGGEVNYKPAVINYDMLTRKIKVLPGIYGNRGELLDIQPNDEDQTIDVLMAELMDDKRVTVTVKTFDQYSTLLQNVPMQPDTKINLLDAQVSEFDGQKQFVAGTYGPKRSKYSRGMFISSINPDGQQQIKYYNYGDLNNFFSYMREKREAKIKKRIARRKEKDKKIRLNYRVAVHELIADNGKYILLGEAYYPRYNNNFYNYYGGYYNSRFNDSYFDGYRYTHGIVVCFDKKGNLLWDHSIKLDNMKSMELEQLVQINVMDEQVVLMYSYDGEIKTMVVDKDGEIIEEKLKYPIKLAHEFDEVKKRDNETPGFKKWYGPYFFAYGIQRIKNMEDREVSFNRKVFFINKVVYQNNKMVYNE